MQVIKGKKATTARKSSKDSNSKRKALVEKHLENPAKRPPPKQLPVDPSGSVG